MKPGSTIDLAATVRLREAAEATHGHSGFIAVVGFLLAFMSSKPAG